MSIANDFALAVSARVETIRIDNGFSTDIGLKVKRGRRRLDPSQLPCAVIIERDDEPQKQSVGQVKIVQPFIVEGHTACDPENPNDAAHLIIADIKRAVFSGNLTLDGRLAANGQKAFALVYKGRSIAPREDGMAVVTASVEFAVEYVEDLSNP